MKSLITVGLNAIPILVMIGLIPFVTNDLVLTGAYILIITGSLFIKREKNDFVLFVLGLVLLTASEYLFVSTGVETFNRHSLFGIMPLWLPVLWGYAFIVIRRIANALE